MFRWRRRKRDFKNPEIRIWVDLFLSEIPRKDSQLTNFPELHSLLMKIPYQEFTKNDVNQESKLPEEAFIVNLFGLDQPIQPNNEYDELILFLDDNFKTFLRYEKEVPLVKNLILRYLIHYMYQIPSIYTKATEDENTESQKVLNNISPLLQLLFSHPETFSNSDQIIKFMNPLFQSFKTYFLNDSRPIEGHTFINDFNSRVLSIFLCYTNRVQITDVCIPILEFYKCAI